MAYGEFNFANAEGAETRTKKLNLFKKALELAGVATFASQVQVDAGVSAVTEMSPKTFNDSAQLLSVNTKITAIENLPLAHLGMIATPPVTQTNTTAYAKVTVMDTVQVTRGTITPSATTDDITIGLNGIYEISPSINVASAAASELVFTLFVDGVQSGEEVYLQGQGATKPAFVGGTHFVTLTAGQVIDMRMKSATSATASFFSCGLAIKKV